MNNIRLSIIYLPVDSLQPYEKNSRKHEQYDIEQIAESIKKFGFDDPIGIWSDHNVIVEGHGRLLAAKSLGMTEVPCIRLDHLTETERRQYAIMHNKTAELSSWDFDVLNSELAELDMSDFDVDFNVDTLDTNENPEVIEDEPVDPVPEPKSHQGQVYQLGNHRLMCGDSTNPDDVNTLMDGHIADMIFTDPPYGVSYTGNVNGDAWDMIANDDLRGDSLYQFLVAAFLNIKNNLKLGGAFYIWYATRNSMEFMSAINDVNLKAKQIIIWEKRMVLGHADYQWNYEPCIYGCHPEQNSIWYGDRSQKTLWDFSKTDLDEMKKEDLLQIIKKIYEDSDIWKIRKDNPKAYIHPTQKPIALSAKAMINSSQKGDIILDLFAGSGSTLLGCQQLDRICYSMECDPRYIDAIIQRWETFTGQSAELISAN